MSGDEAPPLGELGPGEDIVEEDGLSGSGGGGQGGVVPEGSSSGGRLRRLWRRWLGLDRRLRLVWVGVVVVVGFVVGLGVWN
ncbi:MAG: hypothetical protein LBJ02_06675, partial [Bifidobacteriaceae bacterium]|nr:hypothetical protein [Bifidobacteriaceae bacterium]